MGSFRLGKRHCLKKYGREEIEETPQSESLVSTSAHTSECSCIPQIHNHTHKWETGSLQESYSKENGNSSSGEQSRNHRSSAAKPTFKKLGRWDGSEGKHSCRQAQWLAFALKPHTVRENWLPQLHTQSTVQFVHTHRQRICIPMLVAALATKAKRKEQPKCLPTDEFIYIVLVPEIQEILPHPTWWTLETLSSIS